MGKPDSTDDDVKTDDAPATEAPDTSADAAADDAASDDTAVDDEVTDADADADDDADDESDDDDDDDDDADDDDDSDDDESDDDDQSVQSALFWNEVEIDPIEIALPGEVGLTLRHYRTVEDDDGEEAEEAVFLAHRGKLHLFRSAEGLVAFVNSDAPHDLADLDSWPQVKRRLAEADVVPVDEDRYELDLVVENLRGGHDVWEPDLLIGAGEVARDIAFAVNLDEVLSALAPGSPLDDLDDGLRDGGFLARRRLKKVGAEQAAIGWRSIVGKIVASVEWHD